MPVVTEAVHSCRLAALSDGHVSSTGDIVCPYHGWQFDLEGKCTHNPQACFQIIPVNNQSRQEETCLEHAGSILLIVTCSPRFLEYSKATHSLMSRS